MRTFAILTPMSPAVRFGIAALIFVAGVIVAVAAASVAATAVGVALVGLGLVALVSLVFYEVGLSEDRDREREARARRPATTHKRRPLRPTLRRRRGSAEDRSG
jgi:hypothetical protein